jgi:enoyl-CoA hydratase
LKPVIAQVHSYCPGGAIGIALACDMIIASDDTRMGYPPARSMATGDEMQIYSWHVGLKKAKELSLTGDSLNADEMLHYGVANYVYPRDQLDEKTMKIAKGIANIDSDLLALSKRLVNRTFDMMGFMVSMQYGGEFNGLGQMLGGNQEFVGIMSKHGIKDALDWRDGPFGGTVSNISDSLNRLPVYIVIDNYVIR